MPEFANDAVENAQVLVNLIRERGPIRVAKEILAVADQVVKANASDQALFQIDHLARVARTVTSEAVREEIGRLQAESEKLSDRVSAVRTAREQVQSAAVAILEPLSALEELIEPGRRSLRSILLRRGSTLPSFERPQLLFLTGIRRPSNTCPKT